MAFPSQSVDFEQGSSQYCSRADTTSLSITSDITIEGWVNLESIGGGQEFAIFNKWLGTGSQRSYFFAISDVNTLRFLVSQDGATNDTYSVSWTPSTSTWYHVAVSWVASTSTAKFFVNGVQQGSDQTGTRTAIFDSSATAYVSAFEATAIGDGKVCLLRVWSAARTGAEISANMCSVLGSTTNLQAEWTFDGVYTDNSGNSNTLTAVNSPTFVSDTPSVCASKINRLLMMGVN